MGTSTQKQTITGKVDAGHFESGMFNRLRIAFWIVAGVTGFLQIWLWDRVIWADSLSYLDSGDMLWQGDFTNAITNHWSPGFPFLLGLALKILRPTGLWEVAVVKLVDLVIFLFTVGSFDFFTKQFCSYYERNVAAEYGGTNFTVPKLALASEGYLLFLWTITRLLPAWYTTPDMLVMGFVFVILGLLLNIKMGATGFVPFAALGMVLGFGYLVKAPMFPLAFMFMGIAFLLVGDFKKAIPRVALSFALFAIIAAPLVLKLSELAGGLTFGKSGAWNYARYVNGIGVAYHWHGQPPGSGTPLHPTRVLLETPRIYEFGSPVRGTFPPWRDPYYWFAGITPHFDPAGQWRVIKANAKILRDQAAGLERSFIYGFLVLLCMSTDWSVIRRILAKQWFLIFSSIAALAMFSVVLVQDRYIAPYPIVLGLVLFSGVVVVRSANSLKLVNVVVLLTALLFAVSSARPAAAELLAFVKSVRGNEMLGRKGPWHLSSQAVSDALRARGVRRGDRVSYIGESGDFYWARLAGVQVNTEIRQSPPDSSPYALVPHASVAGLEPSVDIYWASPVEVKDKIDRILYTTGSKVIVTDSFPSGGGRVGWDQVSGTSYYIRVLPDEREGDSR